MLDRTLPHSASRAPRPSRTTLVLGSVYLAWSLLACAEILLRPQHGGRSPLPGVLADHNGNIAVSGFIMAAAWPGAWLALRAGNRRGALAWLAAACVPIAGLAWGVFFVMMEVWPWYEPNVRDLADLPGSVFGASCGTWFGVLLQRHLVAQHGQGRDSRVRGQVS